MFQKIEPARPRGRFAKPRVYLSRTSLVLNEALIREYELDGYVSFDVYRDGDENDLALAFYDDSRGCRAIKVGATRLTVSSASWYDGEKVAVEPEVWSAETIEGASRVLGFSLPAPVEPASVGSGEVSMEPIDDAARWGTDPF